MQRSALNHQASKQRCKSLPAVCWMSRFVLLRFLWAVLLSGVISGCATSKSYLLQENSPHYTIEHVVQQSEYGCRYLTVLRQPLVKRVPFTVVLGHGFLRGQRNMRGLAAALADAGVTVATLDFCHMKPWNGHHLRNGAEMTKVANYWGAESVVYAGFSAGALAALVAAGIDHRARALVLLDFVDQPPIGLQAIDARVSTLPVLAIAGKPASCNAKTRGMQLLQALPNLRLQHFNAASHCAFESPTSWLCNVVCGADRQDDAHLRPQIISQIVSAVVDLQDRETFGWQKNQQAIPKY